jgi:hypothetical protein
VTQALDGDLPPAQALKQAIDDLKAYYLEAASAFPDPGTPKTRKEWLWSETRLGARRCWRCSPSSRQAPIRNTRSSVT